MDEEVAEVIERRARLIAGRDERLYGTVLQSLLDAYYLGRKCEWHEHMARQLTCTPMPPLAVAL